MPSKLDWPLAILAIIAFLIGPPLAYRAGKTAEAPAVKFCELRGAI